MKISKKPFVGPFTMWPCLVGIVCKYLTAKILEGKLCTRLTSSTTLQRSWLLRQPVQLKRLVCFWLAWLTTVRDVGIVFLTLSEYAAVDIARSGTYEWLVMNYRDHSDEAVRMAALRACSIMCRSGTFKRGNQNNMRRGKLPKDVCTSQGPTPYSAITLFF